MHDAFREVVLFYIDASSNSHIQKLVFKQVKRFQNLRKKAFGSFSHVSGAAIETHDVEIWHAHLRGVRIEERQWEGGIYWDDDGEYQVCHVLARFHLRKNNTVDGPDIQPGNIVSPKDAQTRPVTDMNARVESDPEDERQASSSAQTTSIPAARVATSTQTTHSPLQTEASVPHQPGRPMTEPLNSLPTSNISEAVVNGVAHTTTVAPGASVADNSDPDDLYSASPRIPSVQAGHTSGATSPPRAQPEHCRMRVPDEPTKGTKGKEPSLAHRKLPNLNAKTSSTATPQGENTNQPKPPLSQRTNGKQRRDAEVFDQYPDLVRAPPAPMMPASPVGAGLHKRPLPPISRGSPAGKKTKTRKQPPGIVPGYDVDESD